MTKTKKVGSTGRFGSRYGRRVKIMLKKVESKQKKMYICPSCKRKSVIRLSAGIWKCQKCNVKFAGGSYSLTTELITKE